MPPKYADSRKRKMKEVAETAVPAPPSNIHFTIQHQQFPPYTPTALHLVDLNSHPVPIALQENASLSAPIFNFQSFTSLLTQDDDDDQDCLPPTSNGEQITQIDQIIKIQGEYLKRTLADMQRKQYNALLCAAEERAAKKLKERELELNRMVYKNRELEEREASMRAEVQILQTKLRHLELTTSSMRAALQDAIIRGGRQEGVGCSEDGESSFVDRDRVEPVRLACRACGNRVATVMMWPCRHVCICKRCDAGTRACPVCQSTKTTSVEVCLP